MSRTGHRKKKAILCKYARQRSGRRLSVKLNRSTEPACSPEKSRQSRNHKVTVKSLGLKERRGEQQYLLEYGRKCTDDVNRVCLDLSLKT
jgi:hypothetical protein